MSFKINKALSLYLVTDETLPEEVLLERVEAAVIGGVSVVQLREKKISSLGFFEKAVKLKVLLDQYQIPLIINDRVDVALACGAAGVHVGREDLPVDKVRGMIPKNMILGASARTLEEALKAEASGADYIGSGAVFQTFTKSDATLIHRDTLKQITEILTIPVVAIGGISTDNVIELKGTGVAGVAVVSGILKHDDVFEKATSFKEKLQEIL